MAEPRARALEQVHYYLSIHRYQQARSILHALLTDDPYRPHLLYLLALCHYNLKQYDAAEEACRQAIAHGSPDDAPTVALLGRIAMKRNDYATAERHLLTALRSDPESADTMAIYAWLLMKAGHEKKARQVLDEALRLDPEDETVLQIRYVFHQAKGQGEAEMEALERYMIYGSNEVSKLVHASRTALFQRRYREARDRLREAFLLDPTDTGLLAILRHLEVATHPLLFPINWIDRVGGPGAVWLGAMAIAGISVALGWERFALYFAATYIGLCIYSWVVPPLLRRLYRVR